MQALTNIHAYLQGQNHGLGGGAPQHDYRLPTDRSRAAGAAAAAAASCQVADTKAQVAGSQPVPPAAGQSVRQLKIRKLDLSVTTTAFCM